MNRTPKICSECGISFVPGVEHRYKVKTKDGTKCQCSYTCYRKAEAKNPHRNYASRRREFG